MRVKICTLRHALERLAAMNVSTSTGTEGNPQTLLDHISEKGYVSDFHGVLVHKPHAARVVLLGDNVRDDSGYKAVFTEPGTSASQVAAASFLDLQTPWRGG